LADNRVSEIHLCERCAVEKGISIKPHFLLADLMAGLVEAEKFPAAKTGKKCSSCGLTYSGFKSMGRLGCAKCYETFKKSLGALLDRIHGCSIHTGKVPAVIDREVDQALALRKMREKLRKLVEKEEFEEAARLRDEIRKYIEK
jgi:protein arginine kinase activator